MIVSLNVNFGHKDKYVSSLMYVAITVVVGLLLLYEKV